MSRYSNFAQDPLRSYFDELQKKFGSHVNFARDPLRSCFDECQKKWNSSLIFKLYFTWSFDVNLVKSAKISYKPTCLVITFNSHLHDVTPIERCVGQSLNYFIYPWRGFRVTSRERLSFTVTETPVLDDLRIVWVDVTFPSPVAVHIRRNSRSRYADT